MTEEQGTQIIELLQLIYAAGLVCAKASCWFLGAWLFKLLCEVSSKGTGLFGRPKL